MLAAISPVFVSTFIADYFKDAFVGLLVVLYFVVFICTRPHIEKPPHDAKRQNSQSIARAQPPPAP
jgi:hypothetical protein